MPRSSMKRIPELEPDSIRAAAERIHPAFTGSPQFVHEGLSLRAGVPVIVKIESVNPIRSFKGRGAWLTTRELIAAGSIGPERAVVAASTGNFGQGLAFAGRALGVPVVVFADERANPVKLERMRAFGATVVQGGRDFDAARDLAATYAAENDGYLLIDGAEPWVAVGAGTLAVEVTDGIAAGTLPELATAYIPVGNGALIIGVGAWLRHAAPGTRIVGVQAEGAPSMTESWRQGVPIETPRAATFAEGIAIRVPVPEALELMPGRVDDMVLVSEAALREAQAELTDALGITVEGGASASWAAILADAGRSAGPVFVLITGSNAEAS